VPLLDLSSSHGSNGIAVAVIPKDKLRRIQGEGHIVTLGKPNANWQTGFYTVFGSPVHGQNDPARMAGKQRLEKFGG
jgi:hypothetical protein